MSSTVRKCGQCDYKLREGRSKCHSCGAWNFLSVNTSEEGDGSVLYEDITSASLNRVATGLLDDCLGGGVILSDVILLGGLPGGGKSTLMLQIASVFCKHGLVLYIAAEEDIKTIKARGLRLEIETHGNLRFLPALSGVASIGTMLMVRKPNFIIVDSVDALSGGSDDVEIEILHAIKKFCVELQSPALIISQINKSGDYAGLMAKQHAVDVLLTLEATDYSVESGEVLRKVQTLKNRSGRAFVESYYEMTPRGLVLTLDPTASVPDSVPEENVSEED